MKDKIKTLEDKRVEIQALINTLEGSDGRVKEAGKYIARF